MKALAVLGLGCVSPVGLSAPATGAALRAGVSRLNLFDGWDDVGPAPDEFAVGRVPLEWFGDSGQMEWPGHERWKLKAPRPEIRVTPGDERLIELGLPAAREAWEGAGQLAGRIGLYLGLDEADSGSKLADALADALGAKFELRRADRMGRASGLAALNRAARHLEDNRVDVALVGAVDSPLRRASIQRLAESGSLRVEDNPSGVIPGEAAVFMVLLRGDQARGARGWLVGTGIASERTAGTDRACRGEGLTEAVRNLRGSAPPLPSRPLVVNDLNGDRYRALEWGLADVRALGDLETEMRGPNSGLMWHPADCIGDCGAASGGVNALWAVEALRKGYAHSDHALVWGASDGPLRAAALFSATRED